MNRRPAISVVMPVHNTHAYVGEAIDSILAQTMTDWELIVVDDGSDKQTLDVLKAYEGIDDRVRIILRDHHGLCPTRNFAIEQAQADLIANLDSDDVALPSRLSQQLEFMEANPDCLASGGQLTQIDPEGVELGLLKVRCSHEEILEQLHWGRGSAIVHTVAIFRKQAFASVGGYDNRLQSGEDLDLYLKLSELGRLANLDSMLAKCRRHVMSTTALTERGSGLANKRRILEAAYQRMNRDPATVHVREFPYPRTVSDLYLSWIETAMAYRCKPARQKYTNEFLKLNWYKPHQLFRLLMRRSAPFCQRLIRAPRGIWKRVKRLF